MKHWIRATALLLPLLLAACLFQPGKFTSSLTINEDRSFAFTYTGEVMAIDLEGLGGDLGGAAGNESEGEEDVDADTPAKTPAQIAEEKAAAKAAKDGEYRELAAQLGKEYGYKTVEYRGDGLFYVDYAITGTLTHNFVYPFNQDGAMIFPWVAVELRGGDTVRVKAPGFAKQDTGGMGDLGAGSGKAPSKIDGTFTLTTDATVVSQNNEDGAKTAGGKSVIAWRITPRTADAPTAVLRVSPR